MKSVVWIYTVNTDGVVIRSSGSSMMWIGSKKFQDKLKKNYYQNGIYLLLVMI